MKINVSRHELQEIRDIIWHGRAYYAKSEVKVNREKMTYIGTKLIKKINGILKSIHGHTCNGQDYF